jgi:hypothetical protein
MVGEYSLEREPASRNADATPAWLLKALVLERASRSRAEGFAPSPRDEFCRCGCAFFDHDLIVAADGRLVGGCLWCGPACESFEDAAA